MVDAINSASPFSNLGMSLASLQESRVSALVFTSSTKYSRGMMVSGCYLENCSKGNMYSNCNMYLS